MITTCPQCNTGFRVTPEQLAIRQGLVRCGHCETVFNGFADLSLDESETVPELAPQGAPERASSDILSLAGHIDGGLPEPRWTPATDTEGAAPALAAAQHKDVEEPWALASRLRGHLDTLPPTPLWTPPSEAIAAAMQEQLSEAETAAIPAGGMGAAGLRTGSDAAIEAMAASLDFTEVMPAGGQTAGSAAPAENLEPPGTIAPRAEPALYRPEVYGKSRQAREAIGVAAMLVALVAQASFLFRSEIAANWPDLKPYVMALCDRLGCQVALPRQIEQLTIEASELQADSTRPNVVLLTAIIRNRGATVQAYPSLEVTLTDSLDRAVARRTLDAADYLPQSPRRDEGIAATGEAIAKTAVEAVDMKPSGYRLRLYYR